MGFELLTRNKPALALIHASNFFNNYGKYTSQISKEIDCTYAHTVKIVKEFDRLGIVTLEKSGRRKMIKLTEKGRNLANDFKNMQDVLR